MGCECGRPGCPKTLTPEFGKCGFAPGDLIPGCTKTCEAFKPPVGASIAGEPYKPQDWETCAWCHFWRTDLYGPGKRPEDDHRWAVCTARESRSYKCVADREGQACPAFYDRHIKLNFLQREGMEQGFSPGSSPVELYFAEHPDEAWQDAFPPEYRKSRKEE